MFAVSGYDVGSPYNKQIANDSLGNALYVAEAEPGTSLTAAKWRIYKITYETLSDSTKAPTNIEWAEGNRKMDKSWATRTLYTYTYA